MKYRKFEFFTVETFPTGWRISILTYKQGDLARRGLLSVGWWSSLEHVFKMIGQPSFHLMAAGRYWR